MPQTHLRTFFDGWFLGLLIGVVGVPLLLAYLSILPLDTTNLVLAAVLLTGLVLGTVWEISRKIKLP